MAIALLALTFPLFFWAFSEYSYHAQKYLQDNSYAMQWDVLYLNFIWMFSLSNAIWGIMYVKEYEKNRLCCI